ncbi:ROK family protein [Paenibacillus sp. GCM10023252]|uniref:ROK family protein n=1 Tax=Paenibacillus sp. GCM10023252 TaxID=3252649 RepID=UPI00360F32B5
MPLSLGIDIGGTTMKVVLLSDSGEIHGERHVSTKAEEGPESVTARLAELIAACKRESAEGLGAVGVTVPGVLDQAREQVLLLPNFPVAWHKVSLRSELHRLTGVKVELLNDARAAAFAELYAGAGQGYSDFICLVLGTGVGGGIVIDRELMLGSRGVGGELGHQVIRPGGLRCGCGNRGCLETIASGSAIASAAIRMIRQGLPTTMRDIVRGDVGLVTSETVDAAAGIGDPYALEILADAADALVQAIRNATAMLNPEAVILGGGVSASERLLEMVRSRLTRETILFPAELGGVHVVRAKFEHYAGAVGAAAWALTRMEE